MTTQVLTRPRRQEVLRAAQSALDALLRDLNKEELGKIALAGAAVVPEPTCQCYQDQAALQREHVLRLLRNRRPRAVGDVRSRLETLRREIRAHQAFLEPHYRKDKERELHLTEEYWRCALAQVELRRTLDEDWHFIEECRRREEEAEPSERQWFRGLSPEERQRRRRLIRQGLLNPTPIERAHQVCFHTVKLLSECCPPLPRPDPVVSEWEAARVAARHGIPLDEARLLLWKSEQLLEPELLEEGETIQLQSPTPQR
jgi:hypothetical protein